MPKIKFFTVGCKVNQYETQFLRERILSSADFTEIDDDESADIYLINTCTVTHKADADSLSIIRQVRRKNPQAKVVVTGCLTEFDEERIKSIEGVSLIVKNRDKFKIPFLFLNSSSAYCESIDNFEGITYFKSHTRAFLKIQDGCDNFCSYCKVPLVRGRSKSRPPFEVIKETERLIKNGYREIVLCGICLGSYGKDLDPPIELIDFLKMLDDLEGDFRIRLSSIEAWDITDKFIQNIDKIKRICPHLHIPIQSGDDKILSMMNRPINPERYLEIIKILKEKLSLLTVTTDILVGFPGEKESNFVNTVRLIRRIQPLKVHIFGYSPRPYTKAYLLKNKVNPEEIKKRINFLKKVIDEISFQLRSKFLGLRMRVLFESFFEKEGVVFWQGLSDNYLKIKVKTERFLKNSFVEVKLEADDGDYIIGEIL